jgi:hypothetical protein
MEPTSVNNIVQLMANFINYLNVSLYEGTFTYNHEQARTRLNEIYVSVSKTPSLPPSLEDSIDFYQNVNYLTNVTYTDDPDYYTYKRNLKNYINVSSTNIIHCRENV